MSKDERYQKLKDIIKIYLPEDVSVADISMDSHFINELNINSANLVDIILDVEDEFNIMLENEEMERMQTVQDALQIIEGKMKPGSEIGLKIDQALLQDATGTLVQLELEAMGLDRAKTEVAVQYVDHNLLQTDFKNADDHVFLHSAAQKFGLWFSRPGNGVSHPLHMERFGIPGKTLVGSDSHSCAAGSLGMLAIGTGGLDVAAAVAGQPYYVQI